MKEKINHKHLLVLKYPLPTLKSNLTFLWIVDYTTCMLPYKLVCTTSLPWD